MAGDYNSGGPGLGATTCDSSESVYAASWDAVESPTAGAPVTGLTQTGTFLNASTNDWDQDLVDDADDKCPIAWQKDQSDCNAVAELALGYPERGDACDPVPCAAVTAPATQFVSLPPSTQTIRDTLDLTLLPSHRVAAQDHKIAITPPVSPIDVYGVKTDGRGLSNSYIDIAPDHCKATQVSTVLPPYHPFPLLQPRVFIRWPYPDPIYPGLTPPVPWWNDASREDAILFQLADGRYGLFRDDSYCVVIDDLLGTVLKQELADPSLVWASAVEPAFEATRRHTSLGTQALAFRADGTGLVDAAVSSGSGMIALSELRLGDPPPRKDFVPVFSRVAEMALVVGGVQPGSDEPTGDIWYIRTGGNASNWRRVPLSGARLSDGAEARPGRSGPPRPAGSAGCPGAVRPVPDIGGQLDFCLRPARSHCPAIEIRLATGPDRWVGNRISASDVPDRLPGNATGPVESHSGIGIE